MTIEVDIAKDLEEIGIPDLNCSLEEYIDYILSREVELLRAGIKEAERNIDKIKGESGEWENGYCEGLWWFNNWCESSIKQREDR